MNNKEKNFVSAVVYVHNDEAYIGNFLSRLILLLENNFQHSEIICVNDASNDNSMQIIKETNEKTTCTSVTVVNMSYFHGLELSMNAGVEFAIGDYIFEFDNCMIDYEIDTVMEVYKKCLEGYDVVGAVPEKPEKISSKLFYWVIRKCSNVEAVMNTERFRVLSRRIINRASFMNKSVPYRKLIYANSGLKSDKLFYCVIDKGTHKKDKTEKKYRTRLAIDSLILFTDVGYRLSLTMALLMMIISAFMIAYSVVIFVMAQPVEGWTTTVLFLAVAFLGLFAVLSIVIKYLQLLLSLVFKRKQYCFESVEKLSK